MPSKIGSKFTIRHHLFIGILGAVWLTVFLVFVAPYDTAEVTLGFRASVMFWYGTIFALSYWATIPLQNWLYGFEKGGKLFKEFTVYLMLSALSLPACYWFYKTDLINGDYGFAKFTLTIFLPTLIIFIPLLAVARYFIPKNFLKSRTPHASDQNLKKGIDQLIQDKIYLDGELSLASMATQLKTNPTLLSKAINNDYGLNFNDFINQYRIEMFLQMVKDRKHKTHTLSAIAEDCGFNSKATFNRAFKKKMNVSPTQYIKDFDA